MLLACGREAPDPTRPGPRARAVRRWGKAFPSDPSLPRQHWARAPLALGLFWPPCEREEGSQACVSGAPRLAVGQGEAIRSHWPPGLASCYPWWPVCSLQGSSRHSPLYYKGGKTITSLGGKSGASAGLKGRGGHDLGNPEGLRRRPTVQSWARVRAHALQSRKKSQNG